MINCLAYPAVLDVELTQVATRRGLTDRPARRDKEGQARLEQRARAGTVPLQSAKLPEMTAHIRLGLPAALAQRGRKGSLMGPVPERPVRADLEKVDDRGAQQPRHLIKALGPGLLDEGDNALALPVEPLDRTARSGLDHPVLPRLPPGRRPAGDDGAATRVQPARSVLRAGQIHLQHPLERGAAVGGAVLLRETLTREQQQQVVKAVAGLIAVSGPALDQVPDRQLLQQLRGLLYILIKKCGRGQGADVLRFQHGQQPERPPGRRR